MAGTKRRRHLERNRLEPQGPEGGAKVAWKVDIGFGYSDVVIQDGRLYTMGLVKGKWTFHCLDAGSGEGIWQRSFDSVLEPMSTPCVDGDRVYGLGKDGTVVCLQTSNGKLLWKKSLKDDFGISQPYYGWATSPVVEGRLLLISASYAGLALDKMNGSRAWASTQMKGEYELGFGHYATPVVCDFDGKRCGLFFGQDNLSAVDLKTGKRLWTLPHRSMHPMSDPIVSGRRVFLEQPWDDPDRDGSRHSQDRLDESRIDRWSLHAGPGRWLHIRQPQGRSLVPRSGMECLRGSGRTCPLPGIGHGEGHVGIAPEDEIRSSPAPQPGS